MILLECKREKPALIQTANKANTRLALHMQTRHRFAVMPDLLAITESSSLLADEFVV